MQRREFITLISSAAATWPLTARGQGANPARYVAWLGLGHAGSPSPYLDSLRTGLRELGWIEGRNLKIVAFWATGREDMEGVAREVLTSDPDVVVTQELMAIAMRNLQSPKPVIFGFTGPAYYRGYSRWRSQTCSGRTFSSRHPAPPRDAHAGRNQSPTSCRSHSFRR